MNMPTPRSEIAATNIDGNIYVIGGFDGSGKALDTVEIYNVYNDSWKEIAPLPEPLHHTIASSHNGKIFVVGGFTSDVGDWVPTNKLFIYDPLKDEWKEGKPMPTARGALAATFVKGTLFAIGGQQSSDIDSSEILNTNEAYDPTTDTWTAKKSMPTSRHHAASTAVDGKIYVIGGRAVVNSSIINLNINEMYSPEKNEWISLVPMPSKRSGIAATSYNDSIFVFGGEDAGGVDPKTYGNNELFIPATGLWTSKESLPTPRHGLSATNVDSKIFAIGGGPEAGLSISNANEVFSPNQNLQIDK
jgi:N-acetylneuraminic acid mutarotase